MNSKIKLLLFVMCGIMLFSFPFLHAVESRQDGKALIPDITTEAIKIDGDLTEKVWSNTPLANDFKSYEPVYGEALPYKTMVWMAYDKKKLYFAFKCADPEPGKIKSSLSPRDKMFSDDWVAVLLDAMGNKQTSYEFYVNPNGIQGDNLNSAVSGLDAAPDFVFESAGKITAEGYQVEIGIPLESIRFQDGKDVRMGVLFLRHITHLGISGSWPETHPGQTDFNFMVDTIYGDLKTDLRLELLPNFTFSTSSERVDSDSWERDSSTNFGASIKYGITSAITTEATINPDFSQVESDAYQVEVNIRYPNFYTEKRPFFMEGMDLFDFGLIAEEGMMVSAVHTRQIMDPGWAGKVSGAVGKVGFVVLAANDNAPGQAWTDGINPDEGKEAFWGIARAKYNLGSDNSLGFLYSGHHFAGAHNNVVGADVQYRFFKNVRMNATYFYSSTKESEGSELKNGNGFNAMLLYNTPNIESFALYELYDKKFVMDSAFMTRTSVTKGHFYFGPFMNTRIKNFALLRKIQPYAEGYKIHDLETKMDDAFLGLGINTYLTKDGFLRGEYSMEEEAWRGVLYKIKYFRFFGGMQFFKWLYLQCFYGFGDQIYYGPGPSYLGDGYRLRLVTRLQPSINLNLDFSWVQNGLSRKVNGSKEKIYTANIINLSTTYQFNKYFFLRGAIRYNDYPKKLLTDFLASYTLRPGTVAHIGYGSLYEGKVWENDRWVGGQEDLLNMKNGLFFKVSYLWRIK